LEAEKEDQSGALHATTTLVDSWCRMRAGDKHMSSLDVMQERRASCRRKDIIRGPKAHTDSTISRSGAGAMKERMRRVVPSASTAGAKLGQKRKQIREEAAPRAE
jgi:hypothetical protein